MHDDPTVIERTRQWLEHAVIGLNLCPFAKAVYVKQQVRYAVSHARHLDAFLDELEAELRRLADADPAELDTTLLIHPALFDDFDTFVDLIAAAEGVLADAGLEGTLQLAHFHPRYVFEGSDADDLGNCTNRAPYPTLHLLREASIARAAAAFPDPAAIYQRNIDLLHRMGHDGWAALARQWEAPEQPGEAPESG
ncbi:hypothetical protein GCM10007860_34210 [Chitiniphilus shinanonensis]|uniref:Peptidase n=1 Tax=Chitiniphilus shinanonensis TaxID=553088 RepID=A0ABQ6BX16_9NEIS|nr:DUF1415 domain-containing protein [Chitiniphilus shinanonensis]GLS06246.1 hypothetical protein GCM10007860_34210 [Chitiniphilus shinanonensis]